MNFFEAIADLARGVFGRRPATFNSAAAASAVASAKAAVERKKKNKTIPALEAGTAYDSLDMSECDVEELPPDISVRFRLNLRGCTKLRRLPTGLKAGSLDLAGCTALEALPEGLETSFLTISDCPQLEQWPSKGSLTAGRLRARNCTGLTGLPAWLGRIAQLDLAGCAGIRELPEGLDVSSWIDIAGTGITRLPKSLAGVGLRWRGVAIDERIAFRPDEISAQEVLGERNAELRRVKLERMSYERFMSEANPKVLDTDRDAGGERKLFRVELEGDEALVCVSVHCPSTGRRYLLRVPPQMATCKQAVAWTAGFDDQRDYKPVVET